MAYVIRFNSTPVKYLKSVSKFPAWTYKPEEAAKFTSQKTVKNYINSTVSSKLVPDVLKNLEPVLLSEVLEPEVSKIIPLTLEEADEKSLRIQELVRELCELGEYVPSILNLYQRARQECDQAEQDLLHKMEFDKVNVVQGYKLYKQMHDLRILRRKIKDYFEFVQEIQRSELLKQLSEVNSYLINYETKLNTRYYTPKILTELFKDNSNVRIGESEVKTVIGINKPSEMPVTEVIPVGTSSGIDTGESDLEIESSSQIPISLDGIVTKDKLNAHRFGGLTQIEEPARFMDSEGMTEPYEESEDMTGSYEESDDMADLLRLLDVSHKY